MIEGLEILSKEEITEIVTPEWVGNLSQTIFFALFLIFVIALILTYIFKSPGILFTGIVIFFVGLMSTPFIILFYENNAKTVVPTGRYRYEALIHDTAAFGKVYEQYEIVDCVGELYILEDKE